MFALDLLQQYQSMNGSLLAAGKIYVYNLGRTQLATVYGDHNGATPIANPVVLDDQGMAEIYLNDAFNYTIVVFDAYGQEQFSRDIYPKGMGNGESIGTQLYEGVDPIVVNNNLYAISANTTKLGVQEPLYFVQDDAERVVIGFSGTEVPAGTMNESAFGYQDGKITGYNGSAFSAGNTYEEGSYIDIDGNTISVTGLTPVPADTASTGLVASVSADITAMIPDTSDMATQTWVNEQGYLTGVDLTPYQTTADMSGYLKTGDSARFYTTANESGFINSDAISSMATTGFVAGVSADITAMIPDTSNMATKTWVGEQGYATEDWVTGQGYLTAHQSLDGLMSADLLEISDNKITGYNGTAFAGQGGGVSGDYELSAGSGISIVDYPLEQKTVISVTAQGGNPEVEQAVIDNSATWDTVSDKLDTTAFSDVSGNFLTGLPQDLVYTADIQDMATTGDLTAYATVESLTAKQDAGDYLSASDSANFLLTSDSANFYPSDNPSAFITGVDLTPYQLTADMTAYQPVGDYLTTADSANFYTTANESGFISEVPAGTMNESAFEYDANDKISGYNGSAFAGGSDVPEGVMVESGLEYNAVNEISGYNGSAIAQYGAEKQWLVHDDTLVHAANSAQYALGVNLSAVAQLLGGIDETILFNGSLTGYTSAKLSESVNNFNRVKVLFSRDNAWVVPLIDSLEMCTDVLSAQLHGNFTMNSVAVELSNMNGWCYTTVANITDDTVSAITGRNYNIAGTATFDGNYCLIKQIVGIGRKQ